MAAFQNLRREYMHRATMQRKWFTKSTDKFALVCRMRTLII
uniref:Uncharacterized protein n=1 Tax=Setaria italica TaxID=4555 RepID=K3XTZ2_SETIT